MVTTENSIYISDKAKAKVQQLMADAGVGNDPSYFLNGKYNFGQCQTRDKNIEAPGNILPI